MEYSELLKKYDVPVPRYTSYPTVPYWNQTIDPAQWKKAFKDQFHRSNQEDGISLYIHLPFCESLCTYCGCNKKITTNHRVEPAYLKAIKTEWNLYCELMEEVPVIREIHLGGGTPTFFSPSHLNELMELVLGNSFIHAKSNFSFEGHPNNTTIEHLNTLYGWGFRRVSYGVQDNDPVVQKAINRIQPVENVKTVTDLARKIGFESVNFDLIYGLPFQTLDSIKKTVLECIALKPDRFAFYSYAHVPWASRGQRLFDDKDLPSVTMKMSLYEEAVKIFTDNNYQHIGMDHFVLPSDELYGAWKSGSLHRNFMGYTSQHTNLQLGLGVSAISDTSHAFAQNSKTLHEYYTSLNNKELSVRKGYFLSQEDKIFRKYIQDISCTGTTHFNKRDGKLLHEFTFPELRKLQRDNLVYFDDKYIQVSRLGKNFIRNICKSFDLHLLRKKPKTDKSLYSKAI
jgi:oxygen-independent coproporphyrinogen III oxidase